jgi:hypothetical protein
VEYLQLVVVEEEVIVLTQLLEDLEVVPKQQVPVDLQELQIKVMLVEILPAVLLVMVEVVEVELVTQVEVDLQRKVVLEVLVFVALLLDQQTTP